MLFHSFNYPYNMRLCVTFCNVPIFYGTFSAPCPTTMLKDHPLMLIQNTYSIHPNTKQTDNGRPLNWNLWLYHSIHYFPNTKRTWTSFDFYILLANKSVIFWFINLLFCIPQYSLKQGENWLHVSKIHKSLKNWQHFM